MESISLKQARDFIALKALLPILDRYHVPEDDAVSGWDDEAAAAAPPVLAACEAPYEPIGWRDGQALVAELSRLYDAQYVAFSQLPQGGAWTPEYKSAQVEVQDFLSRPRLASSHWDAPQPMPTPSPPEAVRQRFSILHVLCARSDICALEVEEMERVHGRGQERTRAKDRFNLVNRQISDFSFKCEHLWKPVVYLCARAEMAGPGGRFLVGCEQYFATDDPGLRKKIGEAVLLPALSALERSGSYSVAIHWDIFNETNNDALFAQSLHAVRAIVESGLLVELSKS
jgi:hypothetical protein